MPEKHSMKDWIAHVFDHPVTDPAWHWSLDAPIWDRSSESTIDLIAETFERSGELLAGFTDSQLGQGLVSGQRKLLGIHVCINRAGSTFN